MYQAMDFSHLLGTEGFSDTLLNNHFQLYNGYVNNTNTLIEKLSGPQSGTPELNEMKRRFGWEFNGMRLHELYFGNMSKEAKKLDNGSPLYKRLVDSFGAEGKARDNFIQSASLRGIGWTIMYYDPKSDRLFNVWIDDHATNHLSGCVPILIMDMWEHAFMVDYGLKKPDYMEAFMKSVDWEEAERRLEAAMRK